MSAWLRPRNFAIAGGIGAAVLLFPRTKSKAAEVSPVGLVLSPFTSTKPKYQLHMLTSSLQTHSNPFETQGVKNIADRYSSGGATSTHTPGVATPRGDDSPQPPSSPKSPRKADDENVCVCVGNAAAQNTPMDQKGAGTHRFNEKFADQKPEEPNAVGKAFGKAHLGSGEYRPSPDRAELEWKGLLTWMRG